MEIVCQQCGRTYRDRVQRECECGEKFYTSKFVGVSPKPTAKKTILGRTKQLIFFLALEVMFLIGVGLIFLVGLFVIKLFGLATETEYLYIFLLGGGLGAIGEFKSAITFALKN